jgi:hypothetical protein
LQFFLYVLRRDNVRTHSFSVFPSSPPAVSPSRNTFGLRS